MNKYYVYEFKNKFTENRSNMILTGLRYKYPLAVYKLAVSGV